MLSDYDEQVLHSVLRSRFGLSRLSHATFGQIPEMIAFVKEELSVLTGYKDVYALPTKYAPRMGGFDNRSPD
jgi:hypothetical protein